MKNIPLTNIEKFTRYRWDEDSYNFMDSNGNNVEKHTIEDFIPVRNNKEDSSVIKTFHTKYNTSRNNLGNIEGIQITFYGDPFDLDWLEDNYMIVSDVKIDDGENNENA